MQYFCAGFLCRHSFNLISDIHSVCIAEITISKTFFGGVVLKHNLTVILLLQISFHHFFCVHFVGLLLYVHKPVYCQGSLYLTKYCVVLDRDNL